MRSTDTAGGDHRGRVAARRHADRDLPRRRARSTTRAGPDPRWDFYVPALVSLRVDDAGRAHARHDRDATARRSRTRATRSASPRSTDTTTTNGRTTTHTFDRATRRMTTTTPGGPAAGRGRRRAGPPDARRAGPGPRPAGHRARRPRAAPGGAARDRTPGRSSTTPPTGCSPASTPTGRRTEFDRDGARPDDAAAHARAAATYGFGYDASGNRDEVRMPGGAAHALGFDAGRPARALHARRLGGSPGARPRRRTARSTTATLPGGRTIDLRAATPAGRPTGADLRRRDEATLRLRRRHAAAGRDRLVAAAGGTGQALAYTWDGDMPEERRRHRPRDGPLRLHLRRRPPPVARRSSRAAASELTTAFTRDADGLVTALGPFTLTRSGPGGVGRARSRDGTLAHDDRPRRPGRLRRARPDRRRRGGLRRAAHARRRRPDHAQGRDRRRRADHVRLRLRRRPAAAARRPRRRRRPSATPTTPTATGRRAASAPARSRRSATTARTGSTPAAARTSTTSAPTASSRGAATTRSTTAPAASCCRRRVGGRPSPTPTTGSAGASRARRAARRPSTSTATPATRSRSPPCARRRAS